jgi:hypothetical protein
MQQKINCGFRECFWTGKLSRDEFLELRPLRACSRSSDQQDQEREVNELQAGVELSLVLLQ